ncbi:MAG: glycosyltransferase family A protein [Verrucomicrobiota bacterium]
MSVSVVMPARNAERTIGRAIESVLAQTLDNFDFVIVDHDSSDRTGAIIAEYARADRRIRKVECGGTFIEACNTGWQLAKGALIARMDADDWAYPHRLAEQALFLQQHPELGACGAKVEILKTDVSGRDTPPEGGYAEYERWINSVCDPSRIRIERFVDSPIPNPTAMIRREVMEELQGYRDLPWAEDYDFWLRMLDSGRGIGKVPQTLLKWYDSDSRVTRNHERYRLSEFQRAKAHFLGRLPAVRAKGVVISGAGPVGCEMLDLLRAEGIGCHAFIEVNPKLIGGEKKGIPVEGINSFSNWQEQAVIISAVGQKGSRERIREMLKPLNFTEGKDFFCVS